MYSHLAGVMSPVSEQSEATCNLVSHQRRNYVSRRDVVPRLQQSKKDRSGKSRDRDGGSAMAQVQTHTKGAQ